MAIVNLLSCNLDVVIVLYWIVLILYLCIMFVLLNKMFVFYCRVIGGELFEDIVVREYYSEVDVR